MKNYIKKITSISTSYYYASYNKEEDIWEVTDCLHREDGPALEWANGEKIGSKMGKDID